MRNHPLHTRILLPIVILSGVIALAPRASAQPQPAPFHWVNKLPATRTPLVKHGTFASAANKTEVGYYIYLPPGYDTSAPAGGEAKRYPVVYYLHGGRPGGEHKSIGMAEIFDEAMKAGRVPPMIYVFVNGGEMSHYDFPEKKSLGETAFVKELIPHIDATYRTIAKREGRALEGFSQGGRGTARIMFKHPELFCSAAPMGGGHQHEKHAAGNEGRETSGIQFEPGNNTYDLARLHAKRMQDAPLRILVSVGKRDMNYEANLDWMKHLTSLGIPFEEAIASDAPHSAAACYRNLGDRVMLFHAKSFVAAGQAK
jgi:endo-1,4-beta-xylanase